MWVSSFPNTVYWTHCWTCNVLTNNFVWLYLKSSCFSVPFFFFLLSSRNTMIAGRSDNIRMCSDSNHEMVDFPPAHSSLHWSFPVCIAQKTGSKAVGLRNREAVSLWLRLIHRRHYEESLSCLDMSVALQQMPSSKYLSYSIANWDMTWWPPKEAASLFL